jgi:hypothetical protein
MRRAFRRTCSEATDAVIGRLVERKQNPPSAARAGDVLRAAVAAGVNVMVDGSDLALDAVIEPPAAIIDALRRHKVEIIALLTAAEAPPNRQVTESVPTSANGADRDDTDWQERAAVMEYDGDIPRRRAEAQARFLGLPGSSPGRGGGDPRKGGFL